MSASTKLIYKKLRGSAAVMINDAKHYLVVLEGDVFDAAKGTLTQVRAGKEHVFSLADGELDRFKGAGSLAQPGEPTASDVPDQLERAAREADNQTAKEPKFDPDAFLASLASKTEEELAAGVAKVGVKKLIDTVGSDVELAKRVLTADASNGDPRTSLVAALDKVIKGGESS